MTATTRSKIAVDLDDVVLDFVGGGIVPAMFTEYAVRITDEQLEKVGFNLKPLLDPIIGYNWWTWLREHDWIWANFPAIEGAMGALRTLRRRGHYLVCVTSKPEWAEANVWKWLGKWRPPFHQVIITDKNDVKAEFTDAAILIDDKLENCEAFAATGRLAILFDRPHNRGYNKLPRGVQRAVGWKEVLAIIALEEDPEA
jgi:5'(3')-deoxyribonucleotidase